MGVVTLTFLIPTLALSSLTPALQPHPRVNFCPLPSEQCYQTPGGPEDRGLAWVGCHGAPQHSQVSTGTGGWGDLGQGGDRGICISPCFLLPPQGLPPDRGGLRPGSLDAEIDNLTSMLAELDGGRGHAPRRPDRQVTPLSCPCPFRSLTPPPPSLVPTLNPPIPNPPLPPAPAHKPHVRDAYSGPLSKLVLAWVPQGVGGFL